MGTWQCDTEKSIFSCKRHFIEKEEGRGDSSLPSGFAARTISHLSSTQNIRLHLAGHSGLLHLNNSGWSKSMSYQTHYLSKNTNKLLRYIRRKNATAVQIEGRMKWSEVSNHLSLNRSISRLLWSRFLGSNSSLPTIGGPIFIPIGLTANSERSLKINNSRDFRSNHSNSQTAERKAAWTSDCYPKK